MNSPQENSPWGIPLGESDSLSQANWGIHEECPGNQIHGEFLIVNSHGYGYGYGYGYG